MTYRRQRRPGPISALFWLMIAGCALIAIAEVNPPITAPLAFILLVLIIAGAVASHQAKKTQRVARSVPSVRRWHVVERERGLKCMSCGAPQEAGDRCPFCATPYLTTASERIITET